VYTTYMKQTKIIYKNFKSKFNIQLLEVDNDTQLPRDLEKLVDAKWQEMTRIASDNDQLLTNSYSYRLEDIYDYGSNAHMVLSKIDYKHRSGLEKLARAEVDVQDYVSKGLAIGGFIKTSDDKFIFGVLSGKTFNDNKIDFIGGIVDTITLNAQGLWQKFLDELEEETGVHGKFVEAGEYLGVLQGNEGNYILLCNCELSLSSKQVQEIFEEQHDQEMRDLDFVDTEDLQDYMNILGGYKPKAYELLQGNEQ
jgi:hypothetical protein